MEDKAKEQIEQMNELVKNFSNFAQELSNKLPKEQQDKLKEELKKYNISDLSDTIKQVNSEIDSFISKYK